MLDLDCKVHYQELGICVCSALVNEALKLGFSKNEIPDISWNGIRFSMMKDPANGNVCYSGNWVSELGLKLGEFQINSDGSFFAEHDLVKSHPTKKGVFVESVIAWGKNSRVTTEAKFIQAL